MPAKFLKYLKKFKVGFQITIDGYQKTHDKVRAFKYSDRGTYNLIIENIKKIDRNLKVYAINLRINYDYDTLKKSTGIVDDINITNKSNLSLSLHRIWQVDDKKIKYDEIFNFINYANKKGFVVNYMPLEPKFSVCYADNYNQVIINYDGLVYKCTARDFNEENSDGILLDNGSIDWKVNKLIKRLSVGLPEMCEKCKLLPSCQGICSQKIMEGSEKCLIDDGLSISDYVIYNFNRHSLINKERK
jgi:uncharacterized protein